MERTDGAGAPKDPPVVLIVDDDDMGRSLCRVALSGIGFEVVEADSVGAAIAYFDKARPDAVLLDLVLPPLSGFDLLDYIRRERADPYLPVLVLTALHDGDAIAKAYDLGASDFATKPIHPLALSQRLRFLLRTHETQRRLSESQARLELAQSIARLGHFEAVDGNWTLLLHRTAQTLLGYPEARGPLSLDGFLERIPDTDRERARLAWSQSQTLGVPLHVTHRFLGWDGQVRHMECHGTFLPAARGEARRFLGTLQDVTERQVARDHIAYLADHDMLTGALTRNTFIDRTNLLFTSSKAAAREIAILLVDLDRFAAFNETYGTALGDEALRIVAKRLDSIWRSERHAPGSVMDRSGVTRVGGDQFALIFSTDVRLDEEGARIGRTIQGAIARPLECGGRTLFLTASVGIAMYPSDGGDADSLLVRAQSAAKEAKALGASQVRRFTPDLAGNSSLRRRLESELRAAIAERTLEVHYQPKLDLTTGRCSSVEALARLRLADGTLCPPSEFLPVSEELGLIRALDLVVLELSSAQVQRWATEEFGPIRIAVNLSHESFWDPELIPAVCMWASSSGAGRGLIDIELTETIIMSDSGAARRRLQQLRACGVQIALDDFGTGHSSLGQVRNLPIDTLKIDRVFVTGLPDDPADVAIARAIIAMAKSLNLAVVAEGVETQAQIDFIRAEGCQFVQGYAIGRPMRAEDVVSVLRRVMVPHAEASRVTGSPAALPEP